MQYRFAVQFGPLSSTISAEPEPHGAILLLVFGTVALRLKKKSSILVIKIMGPDSKKITFGSSTLTLILNKRERP